MLPPPATNVSKCISVALVSSMGASCLSYASYSSLHPHPFLFSRLLAEAPPPRLHLLQICPAWRLQHSHCLCHLSGAVCSADPSEESQEPPAGDTAPHL